MVVKLYRFVRRSSSTGKILLDIVRRLCEKCEGVVVHAYFEMNDEIDAECTGQTYVGFCDHCRHAPPPQGTEPGDAVPLVDYLCWTFICEPEYLHVALTSHQQLAEELLKEKTLVTVKNSDTKKLWFVSLASPLDALFLPDPAGKISLPSLPYLLHYEDNQLIKIPLEHVFIYYPSFKKK